MDSLLSISVNPSSSPITQWEITAINGETIEIGVPATTSVVAIDSNPVDEDIHISSSSMTARQQWKLNYAGTRTSIIDHPFHNYQIINKESGKVLSIANSKQTEGGIGTLQTDESLASQKWGFRCTENCIGFRIYNSNSNLVLVQNNSQLSSQRNCPWLYGH